MWRPIGWSLPGMLMTEGLRLANMPANPDVDAWFDAYENPMKDVMLAIRSVILEDDRITETIKWKAPTFMYEGNLASFNPRAKQHASLLFHTGASIPGGHPLLQGGGDTARYVTLASLEEVREARQDLLAIVDAWCESRG